MSIESLIRSFSMVPLCRSTIDRMMYKDNARILIFSLPNISDVSLLLWYVMITTSIAKRIPVTVDEIVRNMTCSLPEQNTSYENVSLYIDTLGRKLKHKGAYEDLVNGGRKALERWVKYRSRPKLHISGQLADGIQVFFQFVSLLDKSFLLCLYPFDHITGRLGQKTFVP